MSFAVFGLWFILIYYTVFLFFDPEYNQPVDMGTLKSEAYAFDDDSDNLDMAQAALFMSVNE
tara:strand:+ start:13115 stop:13300 length:186 start_codon:yes stop_codon:yes gene_type:complete